MAVHIEATPTAFPHVRYNSKTLAWMAPIHEVTKEPGTAVSVIINMTPLLAGHRLARARTVATPTSGIRTAVLVPDPEAGTVSFQICGGVSGMRYALDLLVTRSDAHQVGQRLHVNVT